MINFGENKQYNLDERALRHIVEGEFTKRPETDALGQRGAVDVISGGLHTWDAWKNLMKRRSGFVHLADFDNQLHRGWYFSRELQNGVIALKIPRELFSGDAANITMQPDLHFKSGYLWKTLFPTNFTVSDIIQVIEEALTNISTEESEIGVETSIIIGYARLADPFTAMRIRVQLEGDQIRSAFPSWDQPSTGNNGKPYSPEQSIILSLAASTTLGVTNQSVRNSRLFKRTGNFEVQELIRMTPEFVIKRSFPAYGAVNDGWRKERVEEIRQHSKYCSSAEIAQVVEYLTDFCLSKEPFFLQTKIRQQKIDKILDTYGMTNFAMIMQNIADCYVLLLQTDNRSNNRNFLNCAVRFLKMAVIHTGFLNIFEYKRLLKLIIQCASEHHANDALKIILASFVNSPARGALYSEVNIHSYLKTNDHIGLSVIGCSGVEAPITTELLYDWAATNLGENYLTLFSKEQRLKIAESFVTQNSDETFVQLSLRYFIGADFDFLCDTIEEFPNFFNTKELPSESTMIEFIREYDRMLLTYRQRIVIEDPDSHEAELDYELFGTPAFFELTKQKHKRKYVAVNHERAIDAMGRFAKLVGYVRLEKRVENLQRKLGKELIPLPISVPPYLRQWEIERENTIGLNAFVADPLFLAEEKQQHN